MSSSLLALTLTLTLTLTLIVTQAKLTAGLDGDTSLLLAAYEEARLIGYTPSPSPSPSPSSGRSGTRPHPHWLTDCWLAVVLRNRGLRNPRQVIATLRA